VDEVGDGRANREDDVRKVRGGFGALGRMEEQEDEPNGFIDRPWIQQSAASNATRGSGSTASCAPAVRQSGRSRMTFLVCSNRR
jgi:hypothetical protein